MYKGSIDFCEKETLDALLGLILTSINLDARSYISEVERIQQNRRFIRISLRRIKKIILF